MHFKGTVSISSLKYEVNKIKNLQMLNFYELTPKTP